MFDDKKLEELIDLLATLDSNTKIYLGCDSVRVKRKGKKPIAVFATVAIVHKNGNKGCKIFSVVDSEPDYDLKPSRPKLRMLNEVQKVCSLATQLLPFIDEFDVEVHLDISQDPNQGSNCAAKEALGYVMATIGIEPKLKPESFASSFGADHIANHRKDH